MNLDYRQFTRKTWATLGAVVGAVFLAIVVFVIGGASSQRQVYSTFPVQSGPLTISVSERGTIKARQQEVIKSQVEGQTTIIFLIEEGTRVSKGDLLVELDSSKLQDTKVNQQIQVQNAEANYIRARENLEVVKNQAKADVAKAELDAQFAKEDLRNYDKGDYPKEVQTAENKITIANEELERATEKLRWTEVLFKEKYVSQTELQADRLSQKKTTLDLELARQELKLLQEYTYKRKVDELRSNVEQTALALERAKRKVAADLAQAEADLRAKESEFQRQTSQLTKTTKQIESCKMIAPTDGLVVYATTGQGGFRQQEPLIEGASVRERQDLIYLPTANDMMAEVKIHESNLDKVRVGLPVMLSVDAQQGRTMIGRISKIAPLPDGASMWMNPDLKVYSTEIFINGDGSSLKTGMSCQAQIIIETHKETLFVPVQAIVREGGEPVAYVVKDGQAERRVVEVGLDNNDKVRIVSGLSEGEQVWATPPIPDGGSRNNHKDMSGISVTPASQPTSRPAAATGAAAATKPAGGGWGASVSPEERARLEKMTPDERRAEFQKRMESMTPEERQAAMERMGRRRQNGEGGGGGGGDGGGRGRRGGGDQPQGGNPQ